MPDMTKIFQLELFIQEIKLWNYETTRQQSEISIEVTVFDCKNVSIKRHDSAENGKNAGMGRGQNFLFTLNKIPTDGNQVFFNVFRNTNKRKLVGTGKIPIHELFGEVFSETFKELEVVQQPAESAQSTVDAIDATKNKTDSKTAQLQKQQKPSKTTMKKGQTSTEKGNTGKKQQQEEQSDVAKNETTPDEVSVVNTTTPSIS